MRPAALALGALLAGGCALVPSVARPPASSTSPASPVAVAEATHEYPSSPVPERAVGAATDALTAVRSFAAAYTNWSASTVTADLRTLAARSIGQARSSLELAAGQTAQDYELRQGGVANQGTVEAVVELPGHPGQFIVVTRERTTATNTQAYQGLAPAWHVALATVSQVAPGRWAVSAWQPQS